MKKEKEKITKIIDEMMLFLFHMGSNKIDLNYEETEEFYMITFKGNYNLENKDLIYKMVKCINMERQEGIESYYWELAGKYCNDTELTLVGMMTDDAKVYFDDEKLEILLIRKKDN